MKTIKIPASVGELLDRITIVEIKLEHASDDNQWKRFRREHVALLHAEARARLPTRRLSSHVEELRKINRKLWSIEDALRSCEAKKAFGEHFVRLARMVYMQNDRRALLKRIIDGVCDCHIGDEKLYSRPVPILDRRRPAACRW